MRHMAVIRAGLAGLLAAMPVLAGAGAASGPATMPAETAVAATATVIQQPGAQGAPGEDNRRDLWRTHLEAPQEYQPSPQLQKAMESLRSVQVRRHYRLTQPEPATQPAAESPATQPADGITPQPQPPGIDPLTLAQLKNMPREGITHPVALADTLYLANQHELAGSFYQLALGDANLRLETQAWVIFQLANCRRDSDPAAAVQLCERLLGEHPACPWASLARFELNLLRWRQEYQPRQLLQQLAEELPPRQVVLGQNDNATEGGKAN